MRLPLVLLATLVSTAAVRAQQMPGSIYYRVPRQAILTVVSETEWRLSEQKATPSLVTEEVQEIVMVERPETRTRIVDGVARTEEVMVTVPEIRTATRTVLDYRIEWTSTSVDPSSALAFETNGDSLSTERAAERSDGELVVVSSTGGMIARQYAKLFEEGTIILALPQAVASAETPEIELPTARCPAIVVARAFDDTRAEIRRYDETSEIVGLHAYADDAEDSAVNVIQSSQVVRQYSASTVPLSALRATEDGADVTAGSLPILLGTTGKLVAMSLDGRPVDEFWLQNFARSTVVVRGVAAPTLSPAKEEEIRKTDDSDFVPFGPDFYFPSNPFRDLTAPAPEAPAAPAPAAESAEPE